MKRVTSSLPFVHFFAVASAIALGSAVFIVACSSGTNTGSSSGGAESDATAAGDTAVPDKDSGTSDATTDSSTAKDGGGYPHRFGASDVGGACEFNRDCKQGLRCECLKGDCSCKTGVRGEGGVGSPCTTNEECGSAVCFDDCLCTDECTTNTECKGELSNCKTLIGFSAKICLP